MEQDQATYEPSTEDIAKAQPAATQPPSTQPASAPAGAPAGDPVAVAPPRPDAPTARPRDAADTEPATSPAATGDGSGSPLLPDAAGEQLQVRWREIQTRFVDDPREAVAAADGLVAELMQTLASGFAERRRGLEDQWQRGEEVGTEDLRVVLQEYRAFFDRLLSA